MKFPDNFLNSFDSLLDSLTNENRSILVISLIILPFVLIGIISYRLDKPKDKR